MLSCIVSINEAPVGEEMSLINRGQLAKISFQIKSLSKIRWLCDGPEIEALAYLRHILEGITYEALASCACWG
jgi:hypothetical protein